MAPRVSIGTPEWRPTDSSSDTTACASRKAASMSPKPLRMTLGSVAQAVGKDARRVGGAYHAPAAARCRCRSARRRPRRDMHRRRTPPRPARRHSAPCLAPAPAGDRAPAPSGPVRRNGIGGMCATSALVHTAWTPGRASAAAASIDRIRPCATAERTTRMVHWPGNEMSAAKRPFTGAAAAGPRGAERTGRRRFVLVRMVIDAAEPNTPLFPGRAGGGVGSKLAATLGSADLRGD